MNDPLALDGQEVNATVSAPSAKVLGTLAVEDYTASGTYHAPGFDNVTVDSPVLPNVLNYVLNVADSITVTSADTTYPATITLTGLTFDATVSDADGSADGSASLGGTATFSRAAGCTDGAISCEYSLGSTALTSADLSVDGLRGILFDGPQPNNADVLITAALSSDPALAPGSTITFVLNVEDSSASGF